MVRGTLRGHAGPVRAVAFSPDGSLLATASGAEGPAAAEPTAGSHSTSSHSAGGHSASSGTRRSGEVRIWNVATESLLTVLEGHRGPVLSLAFSPDGQTLVTGSEDQTVGIWNVGRGLWDSVIGVREQTLRGHGAAVTSVALSPDGTGLVSGSEDQTVKYWKLNTGQTEFTMAANRQGVCNLAISTDGQYLAACWSSRGPAIVWELPSRQELVRLGLPREEDAEDLGLAFSPAGDKLAVVSTGELRIWDFATCQVLVSFNIAGVTSLAFSPSGKSLATGGWEAATHVAVRLWNPATAVPLHQLQAHNLPVTSLAFSPDGLALATGSRDTTAKLWDMPG